VSFRPSRPSVVVVSRDFCSRVKRQRAAVLCRWMSSSWKSFAISFSSCRSFSARLRCPPRFKRCLVRDEANEAMKRRKHDGSTSMFCCILLYVFKWFSNECQTYATVFPLSLPHSLTFRHGLRCCFGVTVCFAQPLRVDHPACLVWHFLFADDRVLVDIGETGQARSQFITQVPSNP
jgi:hypothetical protein